MLEMAIRSLEDSVWHVIIKQCTSMHILLLKEQLYCNGSDRFNQNVVPPVLVTLCKTVTLLSSIRRLMMPQIKMSYTAKRIEVKVC
ncbi:hypothetical protein FKM82_004358 [Ascaphus truei]